MKKAFLFLTPLLFAEAYALPLANPAEPALLTKGIVWDCCSEYTCEDSCDWLHMLSLRLGFSGDYVFNRYLTQIHTEPTHDIDTTKIWDNAAYLALNFCNRVDLFATFGLSSFTFESAALSFDNRRHLGQRAELETNNGYSWSAGGRAILVEVGCFTFGVEGQYYQTQPSLNNATLMEKFTEDLNDAPFHYNEWQVGFGVGYQVVDWMIPYIGLTWSKGKGSFDDLVISFHESPLDTLHLHDFRTSKETGYALGLSLIASDFAELTVEGHFASEKSAFVKAQLRF